MLHIRSSLSSPAPVEHGGDLAAARRLYPDAPAPWIDLSTGINPHAYPFHPPSDESWRRLPQADSLAGLERAAAEAYGVRDGAIVAAPGAQALIQALPGLLPGRRVGVLGPTYAEHALAWRKAGRTVVACASPEDLAACDIGVIVNPNNPDGRIVAPDILAGLAARTVLVIDESFADFTPETSFAARAAGAGAIVLRSFGKTYGLAGVRLGFAIGAADRVAALREKLGPWAVSGPALEIGRQALADRAWLDAMRATLAADCARLDALLQAAGFRPIGGTHLFRFVEHSYAETLADRLGRAGVHVRRFADQPGRLRFGLPPTDGWTRLEAALTD